MKHNSANCNATLDDSPGTSLNVSNSSMLTVVTGLACIGLISFTLMYVIQMFFCTTILLNELWTVLVVVKSYPSLSLLDSKAQYD